jgi:hypothetical protein
MLITGLVVSALRTSHSVILCFYVFMFLLLICRVSH